MDFRNIFQILFVFSFKKLLFFPIHRDFASTETIDTSSSGLNLAGKKERLDNLDQANAEIEKLRKLGEKLTGELQEATMEADVAKGRRDWAFSERDKVVLERESIRTLCDKLRRERDR